MALTFEQIELLERANNYLRKAFFIPIPADLRVGNVDTLAGSRLTRAYNLPRMEESDCRFVWLPPKWWKVPRYIATETLSETDFQTFYLLSRGKPLEIEYMFMRLSVIRPQFSISFELDPIMANSVVRQSLEQAVTRASTLQSR